ncbi:MAG: SAM-dependent methyltransferase [Phycisphaeraceae bacterium]|nr:SAM-dependent methyltransferase [Phycisphaeraceae bacterium]
MAPEPADIPRRPSFLREFLANPIATAAIAPSSPHLAAAMLRGVDIASLRTIVEFGPGTGIFTRAVLQALRAAGNTGATVIALELNQRMAAALAADLEAGANNADDPAPRVEILNANALDIDRILAERGLPHADFILSGLGWPSIPAKVRDAILEKTAAALPQGRQFRTFGYHIGLTLPGAWGFRRTVRRLFSRVEISPVVWRNIPPAFVYTCTT